MGTHLNLCSNSLKKTKKPTYFSELNTKMGNSTMQQFLLFWYDSVYFTSFFFFFMPMGGFTFLSLGEGEHQQALHGSPRLALHY